MSGKQSRLDDSMAYSLTTWDSEEGCGGWPPELVRVTGSLGHKSWCARGRKPPTAPREYQEQARRIYPPEDKDQCVIRIFCFQCLGTFNLYCCSSPRRSSRPAAAVMVPARHANQSPFLHCGDTSQVDQLAVIHLKRDLLVPTILRSEDVDTDGYDEGKVINTRFGSFPHSTLIGIPWGSQVRASRVDTGSRGRRAKGNKGSGQKRKREPDDTSQQSPEAEQGLPEALQDTAKVKSPVEALSGFVHLIPPTPETWTASLPHRTQVVYTPDYSYILHRIRARPGTNLIEAGAGSGSFTHAAARAVFNGYPAKSEDTSMNASPRGKVWSFEFHEQRVDKLRQEISDHGLDGIVELSHRDVCEEGFAPELRSAADVRATAIFLDLPAPWLALKYLTRSENSPLDYLATVHLCTFSPCIEQVQKTVTTLRQLGWLEIEMTEIGAKRIEIRRDRVGHQEEGLRGVNDSAATVEEAVTRLREIERNSRSFQNKQRHGTEDSEMNLPPQRPRQQRLQRVKDAQEGRKVFKEGRLVSRVETEIKTHTSYLVFAVLPRPWTDEDEKRAEAVIASLYNEQKDPGVNGQPQDGKQPEGEPNEVVPEEAKQEHEDAAATVFN